MHTYIHIYIRRHTYINTYIHTNRRTFIKVTYIGENIQTGYT